MRLKYMDDNNTYKTIMLCYPPGKLYQRGEDRSQGNIEDSSATSMRACNDLGYAAAILLKLGYCVYLKDYQTERLSQKDLFHDIAQNNIGVVVISVTNATIFEDIALANLIKEKYGCTLILKGSIFYNAEVQMLELLDLDSVDFLIGGEIDSVIGELVEYIYKDGVSIKDINNIYYKDNDGVMKPTKFHVWNENLDEVPFPARHMMNNSLYVRPDTNDPMATIQTSRGCPSKCIYCLSPDISGKKVRFRSPQNVFEELKECYEVYNIKNFFFKADTFTINDKWVKELCELIIHSSLYKNIQFTANSRVRPLKQETLVLMKKAGCFTIAFGFESGSQNTLDKIKKGTSVEENLRAAKWAKRAHIPLYGFFMIGCPWETRSDIDKTIKHIFEINADFIEIHIALPYYGTKLYDLCKQSNTLSGSTIGNDYFHSNTTGTKYVSKDDLIRIRKRTLLKYYLRPMYIIKKIGGSITNPKVIKNYIHYGMKLLKN